MASELKFQAECTQWFWNAYPKFRGRLRRVKNELDNHPRKTKLDIYKQLNENKATGVIPGDSDLYWIDFHNTYIELKVPKKGVQSDAQKSFQAMVESFGHKYVIIKTLPDFKKLMLNLLHGIQERK